jgi:hypothetical protein
MGQKMEEQLIAPCGMNCGLCVNYQSGKYDLKKKGLNRMYCPGCIPRGQHCLHMKAHCELVGEGLVRFCYECDKFPCKRLKNLDQRYRTKYHLSMIENLKRIKEQGLDCFLQEQVTEWRCPNCGELICCHNGLCLNCQIDVLIDNKRYRWDE